MTISTSPVLAGVIRKGRVPRQWQSVLGRQEARGDGYVQGSGMLRVRMRPWDTRLQIALFVLTTAAWSKPNMVAIGCGDDPKLYNTVDMGQFAVRGFGSKPFCQNVLSALQSDCPS